MKARIYQLFVYLVCSTFTVGSMAYPIEFIPGGPVQAFELLKTINKLNTETEVSLALEELTRYYITTSESTVGDKFGIDKVQKMDDEGNLVDITDEDAKKVFEASGTLIRAALDLHQLSIAESIQLESELRTLKEKKPILGNAIIGGLAWTITSAFYAYTLMLYLSGYYNGEGTEYSDWNLLSASALAGGTVMGLVISPFVLAITTFEKVYQLSKGKRLSMDLAPVLKDQEELLRNAQQMGELATHVRQNHPGASCGKIMF